MSSKGKVIVTNNWGLDISQVTLRHRISNDPSKQEEQTWYNILQSASTINQPLAITYEPESASRDYWWIKFMVGNQQYSCKDNFYCSLEPDDDGVVNIILDGESEEMIVKFSSSNGCKVSIDKA